MQVDRAGPGPDGRAQGRREQGAAWWPGWNCRASPWRGQDTDLTAHPEGQAHQGTRERGARGTAP